MFTKNNNIKKDVKSIETLIFIPIVLAAVLKSFPLLMKKKLMTY